MVDAALLANKSPSWDDCVEIMKQLPAMTTEGRMNAIEALLRNPSFEIRQRALRMGAVLLPNNRLVEFLRDDEDDILRNAGLEMLKLRGSGVLALVVKLLRDPDPDIVLQSILVLDHLKDPRALEPMRLLLVHGEMNVVQAAIVAIGHLGDRRAVRDILPFLEADPWLQIAAVQALGDLRCSEAIKPLTGVLTDMLLSSFAADALAKIGGPGAFASLVSHWIEFKEELDPETILGLLEHVLLGLLHIPEVEPALLDSLAAQLAGGTPEVRTLAASCLMLLGPTSHDGAALQMIASTREGTTEALPACLRRRKDLVPILLEGEGPTIQWGLILASEARDPLDPKLLRKALASPEAISCVMASEKILRRQKSPAMAAIALEYFLRLPPGDRPKLAHMLACYGPLILAETADQKDFPADVRLILSAFLGEPPSQVALALEALPSGSRHDVLRQLTGKREIVRRLPWAKWLEEDESAYLGLACEAVVKGGLRTILPDLRARLASKATPDLIRAMGELGDRESVPHLLQHLQQANHICGALILETLGKIGGPEARAALKEHAKAPDPMEARMAFRSLAKCAAQEDVSFLLDAATHPDWMMRLACVEVLGRYPSPKGMTELVMLAADPVAAVSKRAQSVLEGMGTGRYVGRA